MAKLDQIEIDGTLYEVVPEIAPLFSTSTAYAAGDCVIKDAVLYRFKTAHAAGAWIGTDAEAIEVGKELTDLKQDYNKISGQTRNLITGFIPNKNIESNGTYWNSNTLDVYYAPVTQDTTYYVTTDDASGLVCAFYENEPKTSGASYNSSRTVQNTKVITAPIDGYIAFRTNHGYAYAQIEVGTTPTAYIKPITATDFIARNEIEKEAAAVEELTENCSTLLNTVLPTRQIDFTDATAGHYINSWGEVSENANYSYTKPFDAKPGDTISVKVTGYSDAVAIIAEKIGNRFVMVVRSTSSTETEYTYAVEHIGQYVISYRSASNYSGYIKNDILSELKNWQNLPYINMFTNMAGLGDSLMSGACFKGTDGYDCKEYSWLSMIARGIGAEWYCYSQGGYTTKDWLNSGYRTTFEGLTDKPDCVFIAFGTNDRTNTATIPTGSASDSSSDETFCGYYKNIIELVHTVSSGAVIFCCSLYDNYDASSVQYSSLIYEITRLYSYCHFIDIANNAEISRKETGSYAEGDHFTTVGYLYIAELIKALVNNAIETAPNDYKYLGYDNTSV